MLAVLSASVPVGVPSGLPGEPLPAISSDEVEMELPDLGESAERFDGPQPGQYTLHAESGGFGITGTDAGLTRG